jgi:hypothetical protein
MPDSGLPAALTDLGRELPDDFLLHSITGHSKAHQGLREQLIERHLLVSAEFAAGCAEGHLGNPFL